MLIISKVNYVISRRNVRDYVGDYRFLVLLTNNQSIKLKRA